MITVPGYSRPPSYFARNISLSPAGNIEATNLQAGLEEIDSEKTTESYVNNATAAVPTGRKNLLYNGAMQVAQRGTSFSNHPLTYTADRWVTWRENGTGNYTTSRQTTAPIGFLYSMRLQRQSGTSSTDAISLEQDLESIDSIRARGRTVTISFYSRKGQNYSATSDALRVYVFSGTGTDQRIQSGFSNANILINTNATLSGDWQRFSFSGLVPSNSNQLGVLFQHAPTGTANTEDWCEITGVQLEIDNSVTGFEHKPFGIELSECQRYYERYSAADGHYVFPQSPWHNDVSNRGECLIMYKRKRVNPTITISAASDFYVINTLSSYVQPAINFGTSVGTQIEATNLFFGCPATLPAYNPTIIQMINGNAYIDIDAEL